MLNADELFLIEETINLTNNFFAIDQREPQHIMDCHEFTHHMHQIQRLIMVRSTRREHPEIFSRVTQQPTAELEAAV